MILQFHPRRLRELRRLRVIAIATALIAGCSVILVILIALRLLDSHQQLQTAREECSCCGSDSGPSQGGIRDAR